MNAEAFFDSRFGYKLSGMLYQTGISIGIDARVAVEPNFSVQIDMEPRDRQIIAPGLTAQFFSSYACFFIAERSVKETLLAPFVSICHRNHQCSSDEPRK